MENKKQQRTRRRLSIPVSTLTIRGLLATTLVALWSIGGVHPQDRAVEVIPAQQADGRPISLWIDSLKRRIPEEAWQEVARTPKPLTAEEREWLDLIREVSVEWLAMLPELDAAFPEVEPPVTIKILAGNQGANDGFTHLLDIICTDLSDLVRAYGAASEPVNRPRMFRVLAHEYTHLLTKAWLEKHPWPYRTPFLRAVWEIYYEGLGNVRSLILSERWITRDHQLSAPAVATIAELEPVLLERLQGLAAHPGPEEARRLRANLSAGPFRKKWGALPTALWMAVDTRFEPERIAEWVKRGPGGILDLVTKYARPENRAAFESLADQVKKLTEHPTGGRGR